MSKNNVTVNLSARQMIELKTRGREFNFSKYIRQLLDNDEFVDDRNDNTNSNNGNSLNRQA